MIIGEVDKSGESGELNDTRAKKRVWRKEQRIHDHKHTKSPMSGPPMQH